MVTNRTMEMIAAETVSAASLHEILASYVESAPDLNDPMLLIFIAAFAFGGLLVFAAMRFGRRATSTTSEPLLQSEE